MRYEMRRCVLRLVLCVGVWLATAPLALAQPWVDLMETPGATLTEIQTEFYNYWNNKPYERSHGYKQFKRWEHMMEQRTYPDGQLPKGDALLKALHHARNMPAKSLNPWEPVGPTAWESLSTNPGLGRVNVVAVDPQAPHRIYIGTPSGGLWRSNDQGQNWEPLTDQFLSLGVSGIAINPQNSNEIYLATGDGNATDTYSIGVIKTTDGGATWQPTGLVHQIAANIRCSKILMHQGNPSMLWVGTSTGLFMTQDAGATWQQLLTERIRDIEMHPTNPLVVYASGRRFYRSADGGQSFAQITSGVPLFADVNRLELAVTPAAPDVVYMVAGSQANSGFHGLYRSTDGGLTFTLRSNTPNILNWTHNGQGEGGQSWYDLAIAASPVNPEVIVVGGVNVWASANGGQNWVLRAHWVFPNNAGYVHADVHALEFLNGVLWVGSDGGVFRSNSTFTEWVDLSEGLQITQFYKFDVSQNIPYQILGATQDNGVNIFRPGGGYEHILGGDGTIARIDYTNQSIFYGGYPGGFIDRTVNNGMSFQSIFEGINESGAWVTPFTLHPTNPAILYAGYENVWRKDGDNPWVPISNLPTNTTLRTLEVAAANPDVIYTSTFSSMFRTTNGGQTWSNVSSGLPNLFITSIATHPQDANKVWVTLSGYTDGQKVYHSADGGLTWQNQSANLPNVPVNCIAYGPGSNDGLYIGTDIGVYYKEGAQPAWGPYQNGLPNVIITDIRFQLATQQVLIGTYGRGIWRNQYFNADAVPPVAQFTAANRLVCAGEQVHFQNLSVNTEGGFLWTFEGGTPATSTEMNPVVTYTAPGSYSAKLKVENPAGADSLLLDYYVHIIPTMAQGTTLTEDFEWTSPTLLEPNGWYRRGAESAGIHWQHTDMAGHSSEASLYIPNFDGPTLQSYFVESVPVNLSEADTALLTFRVAYARRGNSSLEQLRVFTTDGCTGEWTLRSTFTSSSILPSVPPQSTPFTPQNDEEWKLLEVNNIPPQARTEAFRVRFEFRSSGGNNIYLDQINLITEGPVSVRHTGGAPAWVIYPNPARDAVHIRLPQYHQQQAVFTLVDATGREIMRTRLHPLPEGVDGWEVPLTHVAAGLYLVRVYSVEATHVARLVIQ